MSQKRVGRIVIVSGPSGAGKTTVLGRVFEQSPLPLVASVSATTRPPRPGEHDGVDYHFLSPEQFDLRRRRGEFLECFEVHQKGTWYGTLEREVLTGLSEGKWVVLEIDVQGALEVMAKYPDAVSIFILPSGGSLDELRRRLELRGEPPESITKRLETARGELDAARHYRYQVVNDRLDRAVDEMCEILSREWEKVRDV